MADYTPVFSGGVDPWTATTSAAVTGGRVLIVSGNGTVAHATAQALTVVGVAGHDAASGAKVTVWPIDNCVHEVEAAGAITAAGGVASAANGQVEAVTTGIAAGSAAGSLIGIASTTAAGSPLKVRFVGRH
jgi:hypothetical protein